MDSDSLQQFKTPEGCAGWDQIYGMIESVHAELEQMFWQTAKLDILSFGVGRTVHQDSSGENRVRFDAQTRECQAQLTFHAGRALELAMHTVYACGADRILGREYPGIEEEKLNEDRKTHNLESLFERIKTDLIDRDMCSAFEQVYLEALNRGVTDVYLDGDLCNSYLIGGDRPFIQDNRRRVIDGVELTLDHAEDDDSLSENAKEISDFDQLPYSNFIQFLKKVDSVYYKSDIKDCRRNIRWSHYSARDHEYGRPYVVIGTEFFARLIKGVINLSLQQWTWDPEFRLRWHNIRQYNIKKRMARTFSQYFRDVPEFPEMKSVEEMDEFVQMVHDGNYFPQPHTYKNLHKKLRLHSNTTVGNTS